MKTIKANVMFNHKRCRTHIIINQLKGKTTNLIIHSRICSLNLSLSFFFSPWTLRKNSIASAQHKWHIPLHSLANNTTIIIYINHKCRARQFSHLWYDREMLNYIQPFNVKPFGHMNIITLWAQSQKLNIYKHGTEKNDLHNLFCSI